MNKRAIIFLMVMTMLFVFLPIISNAEEITYNYLTFDAETGTITDCDQNIIGDLIIPNEIEGNVVTKIGDYVFQSCGSLTSVLLPDSITHIGETAFAFCDNLRTITIPEAVSEIGDGAFSGCGSLTINTDINNKYFSSEDGVLFNKDKTKLIAYAKDKINPDYSIPSGVEIIGTGAFAVCNELKSVTLPNTVKKIETGAFNGCIELKNINIPSGVISIEAQAFDYSGITGIFYAGSETQWNAIEIDTPNEYLDYIKITYNSSDDGVLASGKCGDNVSWFFDSAGTLTISGIGEMSGRQTWGSYSASIKNVVIQDGVTAISDDAFYECNSLTSITIPNSITKIGNYAFKGCNLIRNITIPDGVIQMGYGVFSDCSRLETINIPNGIAVISPYTFLNCSSLDSITIPDRVKEIGEKAFANCNSLTSITIPSSVTNIESGAFSYCSSLKKIAIPDSVTALGSDAFANCSRLSEITIADNVRYIGKHLIRAYMSSDLYSVKDGTLTIANYAFDSCDIKEITIPDSVISIGYDAFYTSSLTDIEVDTENSHYSSQEGVLFSKDKKTLVWYPGRRGGEYIIPDGVTSIGADAFSSCDNIVNVIIPKSVNVFDKHIFSGYCIPDIYYMGSKSDWERIEIEEYNDWLQEAFIHFGTESLNEPRITDMPTVTCTFDDDTYEYGLYTFNVNFVNVEQTLSLITVLYDHDYENDKDILVSVVSTPIISSDKSKSIDIPAEYAESAKIFLWNSLSEMRPIYGAKTVLYFTQ